MYYKGVNLKKYFNILDIRRNILPSHTVLRQPIPGRAGSIVSGRTFEESFIEVDIEIKGNNRNHFRRLVNQLAYILATNEPGKLIFTDEPDKYYLAILEGNTQLREFYLYGTATLVFLIPDPIKFGKKVTIPIGQGVYTFYNNGTHKTRGILTMELETYRVGVTNRKTGEFISFTNHYEVGDIFTIDFINEYVTRNGYSVMDDLILESDFFSLDVGENTLSIVGGSGELVFRERWL